MQFQHDASGRPSPIGFEGSVHEPEFVSSALPSTTMGLVPTPERWRYQDWGLANGRENLHREMMDRLRVHLEEQGTQDLGVEVDGHARGKEVSRVPKAPDSSERSQSRRVRARSLLLPAGNDACIRDRSRRSSRIPILPSIP